MVSTMVEPSRVVAADPRIFEAVRALARVCDGAATDDGRGFNGTDAGFGHRLAELPDERWSAGNIAAAYAMLGKYHGQLAGFGIDYLSIVAPEPDGATRKTWSASKALSLDVQEGHFVMRFPYDAAMVEASRHVPGRRWDGKERANFFPMSSAPHLRKFVESFGDGWEIGEQARALLDGDAVAAEATATPIGSVDVLENGAFGVWVYEFAEGMVDELRSIPTRRWVPEKRVNTIGMFGAPQLGAFLERHPGFDVSEAAARELVGLQQKAEAAAAQESVMIEMSKGSDAELQVEGLGGTLRPFQRAGVAYVEAADGRAFIGDDMGTGKTVQALALIHNRQAYPAVVVSPASVKLSWRDHVQGPPRWTPNHPIPEHGWLPGVKVVALSGRKPSPAKIVGAHVIVLNWDILAAWVPVLEDLQELNAVVFDESHYAKAPAAQRTKAAMQLSRCASPGALKLCMTGTGVVNRPKELIPQLQLIDRLGDMGGSKEFRNRYCETYWDGYRWNSDGASNLEELNQRLRASCFIRRTKADVMPELPSKVPALVPVTLSNRRDYERAEQETIKFLMESVEHDRRVREEVAALPVHERAQALKERKDSKAESARRAEKIVRMNLLRKVCGQGKIRQAVAWVAEFLSSSDSKLIVFAHHIELQEALLAEFSNAARVLGEDSAAKRALSIERFQTDAGCRLIVCSLKAAREGITLTAASDVATIELDWTPATHDQAEDRAHRMGQVDSVTCWYLLAENTIDDDMHELIEQKREVTTATLDGHARRREMEGSIMGALEERLLAKGLRR